MSDAIFPLDSPMDAGAILAYLEARNVNAVERIAWLGNSRPEGISRYRLYCLIRLVNAARREPDLLPPRDVEGGALRRRVMRRAGLFAVGHKDVSVLCGYSLRLLEAACMVEPGSIDPASLPNEQMERARVTEARAIDARIAQSL